jgi:CheY-like chemotaxis protein
VVEAHGEPTHALSNLATLADVVIEPGDLAQASLTDAIARFLHLPEDSLPDDRRAHMKALRTSDPLLRGRRMMIVDDDVYSIFALTSVLERHSISVTFCESGREAVGALGSTKVDAVLMDMVMPDMDGFETIQRIRADPLHRAIPIIAVTARAMPGDREACLSAGADDYVPKPIDIDRLIAHLRYRLSAVSHG